MSDMQAEAIVTDAPIVLTQRDLNAKKHAVIAYVLMGLGFVTGILFIVGAIWGMVKSSDAKGTVFEDHYSNIKRTFVVSFILSVVGILTAMFLIGYVILLIAFIYTLWKVVKGLARITSNQAYSH